MLLISSIHLLASLGTQIKMPSITFSGIICNLTDPVRYVEQNQLKSLRAIGVLS
jgi:hypothetical protein